MSRGKSRRNKKMFDDCDHRGFGKYCHLCADLKAGRLVEKGGRYLPSKKAGASGGYEDAE